MVWKALPLINQQISLQEQEVREAIGAEEPKREGVDAAEDSVEEGDEDGDEDADEDAEDDSDDNDDDDDEEEEEEEEDNAAAKEALGQAFAKEQAAIAKATQELEEANRFDGMPVFSEKDRSLKDQVRSVVESLVEDPGDQAMR